MSTQIKEQEGFIDDLKQDLACLLRKYKDIELQNETLAEKIDQQQYTINDLNDRQKGLSDELEQKNTEITKLSESLKQS